MMERIFFSVFGFVFLQMSIYSGVFVISKVDDKEQLEIILIEKLV